MKIYNFEQYSEAWWSAHLGVMTVSRFEKIITPTGQKSKQRDTYLYKIAGEKFRGKAEETFQSQDMRNGTEREPYARQAYSEQGGHSSVTQVGFITSDDGIVGCSPDALVAPGGAMTIEGGWETKAPKISTHTATMCSPGMPLKYVPQVQGSLWITGYDWWDWMNYCPGMPSIVVRVYPDHEYFQKLDVYMAEAKKKLLEINKKLEEYNA